MSKRSLLALVVLASAILSGTAAMACPWHDAQNQDPTTMASNDGSSPPATQTDQGAPSSAN